MIKRVTILMLLLMVSSVCVGYSTVKGKEPDSFNDLVGIDIEDKLKIDKLVEYGVIKGYPDGSFKPERNVNRGNFAMFISRALELESSSDVKIFSDVNNRISSYNEIMGAYESGIIVGYPDGSFKPNNLINKKDMAVMLERALLFKGNYYGNSGKYKYRDVSNSDLSNVIDRLVHYDVLEYKGDKFNSYENVTRLSTVISIYNLLEVKGFFTDLNSFELDDYFTDVSWITRSGIVSLSITPTSLLTGDTFGENKINHINNSFSLLKKEFDSDIYWDNTDSLKVQYDCHVHFAKGEKVPWNIEPHRTETDFLNTVIKRCNP